MSMALGAWLSGMERELVRENGIEGKHSRVDRGYGNGKRRTGLDWWTYGKKVCVGKEVIQTCKVQARHRTALSESRKVAI